MSWEIKGLLDRTKFAPLTDQQFEALGKCLLKWQMLSCTYIQEFLPCELCNKFQGSTLEFRCTQCPVYLITVTRGCRKTPYEEWIEIHSNLAFINVHSPYSVEYQQALKHLLQVSEEEYLFLEGIYSIELHRRKGY